ncbi:FliI/YscN family ATPase [Chitinivibrio alkaliphilus]|uniref:Flagellar protein export ATPase FliI n=1 Tax=Chitinivibrio alkaliphilus ACht1 TaxID=1313304 RepID=U7D7Y6_9BACT|nr:FliI/YscN family ATPase [Chitinivibrio alkaliphilus]ERP31686.1 flagellar protein export ATPase FliI [Chitinivibrio alkaliphilus ACht1]
MKTLFSEIERTIRGCDPVVIRGRITEVIGLLIRSCGPGASIGEVCHILDRSGQVVGRAEVVGFRRNDTLLMPLGTIHGLMPGFTVVSTGKPLVAPVGDSLLGRVVNGLGEPIDSKGPLLCREERSITARIPPPLQRKRVRSIFETGVRVIDGALTMGEGQRMGIFAGSGVGKSVLLGMFARNCQAHINVIILVGERGREVREFIERDLGEEGLRRSVVVVATSDQPALIRVKATMIGAAMAEYFRDQGKQVMLMCDSVTRLAMAQREIGLTIGEPPASKGYTPSVFAMLPQFLERAGNARDGSITALYTVLVEGGDMDEPVADAVRGILDGHILLSRELAGKNHYPAVDVLHSISRCQKEIIDAEHDSVLGQVRDLLAVYAKNEDLITIGAYEKGSDPKVDRAIAMIDRITAFLRQGISEKSSFDATRSDLLALLE